MKKKLVAILFIIAIVFSLAACGAPKASPPPAATPTPAASTPAPTPEPTPEPTPDESMTAHLKNVDITIAGAELTERDGKPQLRVFYDVTNTSAKILSPLYGFNSARTAVQNGEELKSNIAKLNDVSAYDRYPTLLYPGVTVRACENFALSETPSFVVTVHVSEYRGEPQLSVEFDPTKLSPVTPEPKLVLNTEPEDISKWLGYEGLAADLGPNHSKSEIHLELLDHEVVKFEGEDYLRVTFKITTLAVAEDKKVSAFMDTNYWLFQDGIQLERESAMDTYGLPKPTGMGRHGDNVLLGESNTYVVNRLLHSDSPVVVMASISGSDFLDGDPFIGAIIPVK